MRILKLLAVAILLPTLAACATSGTSSSAPPPAAQTLVGDYLIGVDDEVQVTVWRNPELGITVPVRPDGKISVPLVAGGITEFAAPDRADLFRRNAEDGTTTYAVRLDRILNRGELQTNYQVAPGDVITIPERTF